MNIQSLNGTWQMLPKIYEDSSYMQDFQLKDSYPVQVPGSVLSCLIEEKAIDDPYFRQNEYAIRELFWQDYCFERDFIVDEALLAQEQVELVCYGLDTLAEIYLNGQFVKKTANMHRTWRIPVKDYLQAGENHIQIRFSSTLRYIENYQADEKKKITIETSGAILGNQYIRKAHSMFGWDWGAQLPDAGIFRDIQLEAYSQARLAEVRYVQNHEDIRISSDGKTVQGSVKLEVEPILEYCGTFAGKEEVILSAPDGTVIEKKQCTDSQKVCFEIAEPKLWWPNGLGEHPLYQVEIRLYIEEKLVETRVDRIGLRTFTVSCDKDQWGEEFAFMVNGVKFFAMGADYIPEDCVYSWITKERLEYLIRSSVKANYNCLRVWGGGYYPSDTFYDLCDEYGLVVWQDLMYACNVYDVTEEFEENIIAETIDNVKRLRHHASLGLWCGNNELESAWMYWSDYQTQTPYLRADYIRQFEHILPKALKSADDKTFFWPSSPSSGGCFDEPGDENRGDTHYWDVWHGQKPFSDYQKYFFRFCSEFGFQSFPSWKTVYSYTNPEDRNIFSQVMESHQKNDSANGKMLYYISENFHYPKDFESLLYTTQILQAVAIKSGVEHWRRNRGRCMGAIYWQINDNWPVASWASIDYYGRWKALHYMAKNFFMPVAGSLVRIADKDTGARNGGEHFSGVSAYVQNESFQPVKVQVTLNMKTFDFQVIDSVTESIVVEPFSAKKAIEVDYAKLIKRQPRILTAPAEKRVGSLYDKKDIFVEAIFAYEDGRIQIESETLVPYKHVELPKVNVKAQVEETVESYKIVLQSDSYAPFVELDFADADVIFEDNYFNLTSVEKKEIVLKKEDIVKGSFTDAEDVKKRLQIRTIRDTY